ncbi:hypothetical protein ACFRFQ_22890 [Rhodococcus sp. NPDC056743]|uniref:hypothetical protein n=1 Tax=Rhodococcus sp. NPDC056743 TaxID=3345934 RepID=UPI00366CA3FC
MLVRRSVAGLAVAGLFLAVVSCGGEAGDVVEATDVGVAAESKPVPARLVVHRPAYLDTNISPDDVPVWPGPNPSEFLLPSPPSGLSGEIAGDQAVATYAAALHNPSALWNVGGTVQWLVVDPLQ